MFEQRYLVPDSQCNTVERSRRNLGFVLTILPELRKASPLLFFLVLRLTTRTPRLLQASTSKWMQIVCDLADSSQIRTLVTSGEQSNKVLVLVPLAVRGPILKRIKLTGSGRCSVLSSDCLFLLQTASCCGVLTLWGSALRAAAASPWICRGVL